MTLVGVDTGGTFTDLVWVRGGRARVHKVPSTPDDPSRAIREGIAELVAAVEAEGVGGKTVRDAAPTEVVHGTTVATNALLERTGALTALVTNEGFEDLIEIGRQDRPDLYDPFTERPACPVPRALRFGVAGRRGPRGEPIEELDERALAAIATRLARLARRGEVGAVAVCFLHSYAEPADERRAGELLAGTGLPVSLSSDVRPEFREYERTSTTVLNASLVPVLGRYLDRLQEALAGTRVRIMHSSGGLIPPGRAAVRPIETALSGPAGGVAGAARLARAAGLERVITLDMGGTSTDVALFEGEPRVVAATRIGGHPVRIPVLDIETVGAGGGSIARLDAGGALAVGPESAGADPGPICYGRGGQAVTVTDADLFLGRLHAPSFLAGRMGLDVEASARAVRALAREAGLSPGALAAGVGRVAASHMARAVRRVSVERGHDPSRFTLVAFGGAGPVHAVSLARELRIGTVIVPRDPGIFSAHGMAHADVALDRARAYLARGAAAAPPRVARVARPLEREVERALGAEGFAASRIRLVRSVDVRYVGQSHEIEVPLGPRYRRAFDEAHARLHGHAHPDREVEVVAVRVRGLCRVRRAAPAPIERGGRDPGGARTGTVTLRGTGRGRRAPVYDRALLRAGNVIEGPATIAEETATTHLPAGAIARVAPLGHLVIEVGS